MRKIYTFTCLLMLMCMAGFSQNRYVSPAGTDSGNDCTLPGNPCAGIGYAISQAADGDSVLIGPGNYLEHGIEVNKRLVIRGMDTASKPVVRTDTTFLVYVNEHHVRIHYLELRLGLTPVTGMTGIMADNRLDSLVLSHNDIFSEKPFGLGMVFDAYGIFLYGEAGARVDLKNNYIGVESVANDAFGRSIGLGRNIPGGYCPGGVIGGSSQVYGNEFNGFYSLQAIAPGNELDISHNYCAGTFFINYVTADSILVRNNVISTGGPNYAPYIPVLFDISKSSDSTLFRVESNILEEYAYVGLLAGATGNIAVRGNEFRPLSTATDFVSCMINTKHTTAGPDASPGYAADADIRGNIFEASSVNNSGYAIYIGDHNSGFATPFGNFVIGGNISQDFNHFDTSLEHYIYLDSHAVITTDIALWASYFPTATMRVEQDFTALEIHNVYGLTGTLLEDKLHHETDHPDLGFITTSLPSAVNDLPEEEAHIFPNPASDILYIAADQLQSYRISDIHGKEVMPLTIVQAGETAVVNCEYLLPGLYIIQMQYKDRPLKYTQLLIYR